jgi:hypothetical protein
MDSCIKLDDVTMDTDTEGAWLNNNTEGASVIFELFRPTDDGSYELKLGCLVSDTILGNEGTCVTWGDIGVTRFVDMDREYDDILILILILIGNPMLMLPDTEPKKCLMYAPFPSSKLQQHNQEIIKMSIMSYTHKTTKQPNNRTTKQSNNQTAKHKSHFLSSILLTQLVPHQ